MRYRQVSREWCNIDPIAPHFYVVNWGLQYIIFLFLLYLHRLWVLVSNHLIEAVLTCAHKLIYVLSKNQKIIKETLNRKLSFFTVIKIRRLLHRRVFVMKTTVTIKS